MAGIHSQASRGRELVPRQAGYRIEAVK